MRIAFYNMMYALQDEPTQIYGAVEVLFAIGDTLRTTMDSKSFQSLTYVVEAVPLYWTSIHICFEDKVYAQVIGPINFLQGLFDTKQRMRLRLHHGKCMHFCVFCFVSSSSFLLSDSHTLIIYFCFVAKIKKKYKYIKVPSSN